MYTLFSAKAALLQNTIVFFITHSPFWEEWKRNTGFILQYYQTVGKWQYFSYFMWLNLSFQYVFSHLFVYSLKLLIGWLCNFSPDTPSNLFGLHSVHPLNTNWDQVTIEKCLLKPFRNCIWMWFLTTVSVVQKRTEGASW